ncbi:MAG: zinc metallopeptidase [Bacteroidia bacterium]|nr:zinc metallopeptidase [Bacteroidia bacterium]
MANPYIGIYFISIIFMVIGMIVGGVLKSRMNKYASIANSSGLTGAEVAQRMLRDNGIFDVKVTSVQGFLTDHYNPANKTVNLSPYVYQTASVMAAAVAAHEVGHAVQHATGYQWLKMRSALVPIVKIGSGMVLQLVLIAGILLVNTFPGLLLGGICLFGATTLFSLITLPVEVDASRRGLAWINQSGVTTGEEYKMAKDGLRWAAMTYFVAAIQSLATLLYYIMIFAGRSRELISEKCELEYGD